MDQDLGPFAWARDSYTNNILPILVLLALATHDVNIFLKAELFTRYAVFYLYGSTRLRDLWPTCLTLSSATLFLEHTKLIPVFTSCLACSPPLAPLSSCTSLSLLNVHSLKRPSLTVLSKTLLLISFLSYFVFLLGTSHSLTLHIYSLIIRLL